MPFRRLFLIPLLAIALIPSACGEDEEEAASSAAGGATATATPEADASGGDLTDTSTKPTIEPPSGEPPAKLEVQDIVEGKGQAAEAGDTLTMQYVGASWSTGEEFDASWDRGEPFSFQLGQGMVIQGWDEGIEGMKAGGRRRLVIPPEMAYGPAGSPPAIGPNETLVFIVDLLEIQ